MRGFLNASFTKSMKKTKVGTRHSTISRQQPRSQGFCIQILHACCFHHVLYLRRCDSCCTAACCCQQVQEVMSQPVIFVTADTGIEDCLRVCLRTVMRHVDAAHRLEAMIVAMDFQHYSLRCAQCCCCCCRLCAQVMQSSAQKVRRVAIFDPELFDPDKPQTWRTSWVGMVSDTGEQAKRRTEFCVCGWCCC